MRTLKLSYIFVLAILISACPMAQPVSGAEIAVSPGQSIQDAVGAALTGDVIVVSDGIYDERFIIRKPLTLVNKTPRGARTKGFVINGTSGVTIKGFEVTNSPGGGVHITNTNYVVVEDCWFHDYGDSGVEGDWRVGSDGRYTVNGVTVRNCLIEGTQFGIGAIGHNWLVENNEIRGLRNIRGGTADVDYVRFFGENITFRDNFFHGTRQADIGGAHLDFFQTFVLTGNPAYCRDVTIEGNVLDFAHQGVMARSQISGRVGNFIIRNNVFKNTQNWMLSIKEKIEGVTVDHNVFHGGTTNGIGIRAGSSASVTNNVFLNIPSQGAYWANASELTSSNNLLWNTREANKTPPELRAGDIKGNPLFRDPANNDYALLAGSPAIGAGTGGTDIGLSSSVVPPLPPPPPPLPPPEPSAGLPVALTRANPSAEVGIELVVPEIVLEAVLSLQVFDADQSAEGSMSINGGAPVVLFGPNGVGANNNVETAIDFSVAPGDLVTGTNTFAFELLRTQGYTIKDILVTFVVPPDPPPPEPPPPEPTIFQDQELRDNLYNLLDEISISLGKLKETLK